MIGSHLVEEFLVRGDSVVVLDNLVAGREEFLPSGIELWKRDIRDHELDFSGFDGVMHLAAEPFIPDSYERPREVFDVNTFGALNILLKAQEAGVKKIIVYSSSEVYGSAVSIPMDEAHPTSPRSTYAVSKLACDRLAWTMWCEHKIPVVIMRQFNVFGPRCMQPYVIPTIIKQLFSGRGEVKLGNTRALRDFTYVTDAAKATVCLWEKGEPGEVYNVGTGAPRSVLSVANDISKLMGKNSTIVETRERMRPIDVWHLEANPSKIRALGWENEVSWEDGLTRTIEWFSKNQNLFNEKHPLIFRADNKNYGLYS